MVAAVRTVPAHLQTSQDACRTHFSLLSIAYRNILMQTRSTK